MKHSQSPTVAEGGAVMKLRLSDLAIRYKLIRPTLASYAREREHGSQFYLSPVAGYNQAGSVAIPGSRTWRMVRNLKT